MKGIAREPWLRRLVVIRKQHSDVETDERRRVQDELRALRREVMREGSAAVWDDLNTVAEQRIARDGYAWWGRVTRT